MYKNQRYLHPTLVIVALFAFIVGSISFFSRPILFYDEIINSHKASIWHVFDYALRPVFYAVNAFAWQFFGGGQEALRFAYLLMFTFVASLSFHITNKISDTKVAFLSVLLLLLSGQYWTLAITAMPHTVAAIFVLLITLTITALLDSAWVENTLKINTLTVLAFLLILALLTHPTNLVLIPIASVFALTAFIRIAFVKRTDFKNALIKFGYFHLLLVALVIIVDFIYRFKINHSYLILWRDGLAKFDEPQLLAKYFKPFTYYLELLSAWLNPLFLLSIIVFTIWLVKLLLSIAKKGFQSVDNPENRNYLTFSLIMFGMLLFISLSSWKFDRVVIGIYPLIAIFCALSLNIFFKLLPKNVISNGIKLVILVFIFWDISNNYYAQVQVASAGTNNKNYIGRLGQILKSLPDSKVLYLGKRSGIWRGQVQIGHAEKQFITIDPEDRKTLPNESCDILDYFGKNQINLILVHNSLPDIEKAKLEELIKNGYLEFIYSDGREYQLWKVSRLIQASAVLSALLVKDPSSKVYVTGVNKKDLVFDELNRMGFKASKLSVNYEVEQLNTLSDGFILVANNRKASQIEFTRKLLQLGYSNVSESELMACDARRYALYDKVEE